MKKLICILTVMALTMSVGCSSEEAPALNTREYVAMDTVFSIRTGDIAAQSGEVGDVEAVFDRCEALTEELEAVLSATDPDSDVSEINAKVDAVFDVNSVLAELLLISKDYYEYTEGAFDPAIGALTSLWNVKGGGPVPSETEINRAKAVSGFDKIEVKTDGDAGSVYKSDSGTKLDLGAIGKGYAAQRIAEELYGAGISYGIISVGRTVAVFGEKPDGSPFKIGIADPADSDGVVGYLYTESGFVSVAGDYEQYFEENGVRYHHIIDPSTGYPADSGLSSVAVLTGNGSAADALSTALLVMGLDRALELYDEGAISFEAVFIGTDGSVTATEGLGDRFELAESYLDNATSAATANAAVGGTSENTGA